MAELDGRCMGVYCGRTIDLSGNSSSCGACQSGYRSDSLGICRKCDSEPCFYDWMYLLFMCLISLALHWFFIEITSRQRNRRLLILHVSALLESVCAGLCTLLVIEPFGQLTVVSCSVYQLADWYTLFHNPSPDYVHVTYCTQEAVYPLYSMVFIYYALSLAFMLLVRPLLSAKLTLNAGTRSIYAALYFFPMLICVHAVMAGFMYYSFPYIVITCSLVTNVIHLSHFHQQSAKELLRIHAVDLRNVVILVGHWSLHAFGIISLTQLKDLPSNAALICLVPVPAMFYVATVRFTEPSSLDTT